MPDKVARAAGAVIRGTTVGLLGNAVYPLKKGALPQKKCVLQRTVNVDWRRRVREQLPGILAIWRRRVIIRDEIRKCVMFVGYRMEDGTMRVAGTAFLVGSEIVPGQSISYLITAEHVIRGVRSLGLADVFVRLNFSTRPAEWLATRVDDWVSDPDDRTADLAILPRVSLPRDSDHLLYPLERFVNSETISNENIGVGTDVFLTGLFVNHIGELQSIPIVRTGVIAAMPTHPVRTRLGPKTAYLIEARSIGGLSGSPVFANLGTIRVVKGQLQTSTGPVVFLLGVVHGHFDSPDPDAPGDAQDRATAERINVGIAVVTPSDRVVALLAHPAIAEGDAELRKTIERSGNLIP